MQGNIILKQSEIFTSLTLIGCNLNILTIIQYIRISSAHFELLDLLLIPILSIATVFCYIGILEIRNKNLKGFKSYFIGQIIEMIFYITLIIIPLFGEYKYKQDFRLMSKIGLLIAMSLLYLTYKKRLTASSFLQVGRREK